jgi:hypothetical protein
MEYLYGKWEVVSESYISFVNGSMDESEFYSYDANECFMICDNTGYLFMVSEGEGEVLIPFTIISDGNIEIVDPEYPEDKVLLRIDN